MSGPAVLGPKEFKKAQLEVIASSPSLPTDPERLLKARNRLAAQNVFERADHGRLADVRELIALRIAPWLRPHA